MAGGKWIQKAIKPSHRGLLHKKLHVPQDEPIPAGKLAKAKRSDNPTLAHEANLAQTLKHLHHADGGKVVGDADGDAAKHRMDRPARKR